MRFSGLTLLVFLVTILPGSKAQKSKKPDLNFRIEAIPSTIDEGTTEEIEVRCDYFGPSTLVSIGIVKRSQTSKDVQTLAHIALNETKQVVAENGIKAEQTSGEIKADGQSGYLSIKWSTPSQHQKGLYKCRVVARVEHGQIVKGERSVRVKAKKIDLASLLRIVGSLKEEVSTLEGEVGSVKGEVGSVKGEVGSVNGQINSLKSEVGSVKGEVGLVKGEVGSVKGQVVALNSKIGSVNGEVGSVKGQVATLQGQVGSVKGEIGSMKGDIGIVKKFLPSKRYNNRSYYLKLNMPVTESRAQAFCQELGGYLAEIDNRAEYDFVLGFLSNKLSDKQMVLIAGSDSAREGTWVFRRTNTPVPFFNWAPGQPDDFGGDEDCMCILNVDSRFEKMNDLNCNLSVYRNHFELGILCEVPE